MPQGGLSPCSAVSYETLEQHATSYGVTKSESGRLDRNEGPVAWLQPGIGRLTLNGMDVTDDLAGPIQIQKEWLNHLNVFCTHAGHSGDLDLSSLSTDNIEALRQQLAIDERCFALGRYAVIVKHVPEFINRMKSAARAKGFRIIYESVNYYAPATFHGNFRDVESVFRKQEQYSYQREFRFAIDTGSIGKYPLKMDIGNIGDITLQLDSTELNPLIGVELKLADDSVQRS